MVGEKFRICKANFRLLQQLCERNERLGRLFGELGLGGLAKRCD